MNNLLAATLDEKFTGNRYQIAVAYGQLLDLQCDSFLSEKLRHNKG